MRKLPSDMTIEFQKALAKCHDCKDELEGSFTIDPYDYRIETWVGEGDGELVSKCKAHHREKRKEDYDEKLPKHNCFGVSDGEKDLGELNNVPPYGPTAVFFIDDEDLLEKFLEEIRSLQGGKGLK